MKVYVLDQGCCDDSIVLGVFSTKEKAIDAMRKYLEVPEDRPMSEHENAWSIKDCLVKGYVLDELVGEE